MIKDGITLNVYGPDGNIVKTAKTAEGKNKLSFTAKTSTYINIIYSGKIQVLRNQI